MNPMLGAVTLAVLLPLDRRALGHLRGTEANVPFHSRSPWGRRTASWQWQWEDDYNLMHVCFRPRPAPARLAGPACKSNAGRHPKKSGHLRRSGRASDLFQRGAVRHAVRWAIPTQNVLHFRPAHLLVVCPVGERAVEAAVNLVTGGGPYEHIWSIRTMDHIVHENQPEPTTSAGVRVTRNFAKQGTTQRRTTQTTCGVLTHTFLQNWRARATQRCGRPHPSPASARARASFM